jgi:hypothetical protein
MLSVGQSYAGLTIVATSAIRKRGAKPKPAGSAVTDRRGRFSLQVPAGPSRTYRLVFAGSGGALGAARGVSVRVPASSTIHASRRRLAGGRVRFSGRLRNCGQSIPGRGLVLILQGRERGKWRTFEDTRTDRKGRWHVSYDFRPPRCVPDPSPHPQAVELPLRARVLAQADDPGRLTRGRSCSRGDLAFHGRTIGNVKADGNGRFRFGYQFRRTLVKARYRFQARLTPQPGYPYRGATSRRVSVVVSP